jgi:hypothetical protein
MKDRFDTKKDGLMKTMIFCPTIVVTVFTIIARIFNINIPIEPLIFMTVLSWIYLIIVWRFTYYYFDQNTIIARFAYIAHKKTNVNDIVEIKTKYSGGRIYGLSFDIIILKLKNGKEIIISPKDKEGLINEIEKRKNYC